MRVICAPDSFKESMSAAHAADAMARGIATLGLPIEVDRCPVSDGGEGFVAAMQAAAEGQPRRTRVTGPIGEPIDADWARLPDGTAVIEMAAASGLERVPPAQRDPLRTTTFGTGELIRAALDAGCARILLGIGGSATCDGGAGMAQALGVVFHDAQGHAIDRAMTGGLLMRIQRIDASRLDPRLRGTEILVACDVTNPLTGPDGAAAVYGPQKGATPAAVKQLDAGLAHLATLLGRDPMMPGGGAAGGLGYGLVACLGARLGRGIDLVLDACRFDQRVRTADLCLTGEGRLDGQSLAGKAVIGVAQAAAKHGVPTIALVGSAGDGAPRTLDAGLRAYRVIGEGLSVEESIRRGPELLAQAAAAVARDHLPV